MIYTKIKQFGLKTLQWKPIFLVSKLPKQLNAMEKEQNQFYSCKFTALWDQEELWSSTYVTYDKNINIFFWSIMI